MVSLGAAEDGPAGGMIVELLRVPDPGPFAGDKRGSGRAGPSALVALVLLAHVLDPRAAAGVTRDIDLRLKRTGTSDQLGGDSYPRASS